MTLGTIIAIWVIMSLIFGFASGYIAGEKGRDFAGFFILGALTGIIGLIVAAGVPVVQRAKATQPANQNVEGQDWTTRLESLSK